MDLSGRLPSGISTVVLAAGSLLYHGTHVPTFRDLNSPAWLAFDPDTAESWIGWRTWRHLGNHVLSGRVVTFRVLRDVTLPDVRLVLNWIKLFHSTGGHNSFEAAAIMKESGIPGWYANMEVMLTDTSVLEFVQEKICVRHYLDWRKQCQNEMTIQSPSK